MADSGEQRAESVGLTGSGLTAGIDRSIVSSQLLFSSVVLAVVGFVLVSGAEPFSLDLFYGGALVVIAAGAASVIIPWNRINRRWITAIPLIDIVAVGLMHLGMPQVATGLLWVFPMMWLATYLSGWAMAAGLSLAFGFIVLNAGVSGREVNVEVIPEWLVLPLVLILVAVTNSASARRMSAQRKLQLKQARLLAKALARARAQEVLMSEILDSVAFGIVRFANNGEVTLMNRAQEQYERIRGEDDDIFDADGVSRILPQHGPRAQALAGHNFTDRIIWYGRAERQRVALAVSAARLQSPGSMPGDVIMVYRDVTEQLNAVRARDDLISSVSHELRTPLTSMIGYIELVLDDEDLAPTVRKQLDIAERNGERLLELITQILEASRGDQTVHDLVPAWTDLTAIIQQSVESQQLRAAERGIRIDLKQPHPTMAWVDPSRIRQVVDNMLSNAIKYNREYGLVTIEIDEFRNEVAVRISDTGFGVSPDELPKVFDRHFRSERVRNSTIHGNGLGLAISRDIARQHGGELEMVSVSGEGSTVMLVIPKGAPDA